MMAVRQRSLLSRRGLTEGRRGYPLGVDAPGIGHLQWVSAAPEREAWYVHDRVFYRARLRRWRGQSWNRLEIATGPSRYPWETSTWVEL